MPELPHQGSGRWPTFDEAVRMPRDLTELRAFIGWLDELTSTDVEPLTEDALVGLINLWRAHEDLAK